MTGKIEWTKFNGSNSVFESKKVWLYLFQWNSVKFKIIAKHNNIKRSYVIWYILQVWNWQNKWENLCRVCLLWWAALLIIKAAGTCYLFRISDIQASSWCVSNLLESGLFIGTLQLGMKMQKLFGTAESSLSWRKAVGSYCSQYLISKH